MVTADVIGQHPSIPHDAGLETKKDFFDDKIWFKKTTLTLMKGSRNKFRTLQLVPNLYFHTHVYLWTKMRLNF